MLTSTLDAMALTVDGPTREPEFQHVYEAPAMKAEKRKATEPADNDVEESKKRSTAQVEETAAKRRVLEMGRRKKSMGGRRKKSMGWRRKTSMVRRRNRTTM